MFPHSLRPTTSGLIAFPLYCFRPEYFFDFLFYTGVYSISSVVTVSSALQSDPAIHICGFPKWHSDTESAWQCRRHRFDPWVRKISCRRKWQSPPVFLPGKSHGQRSPTGYIQSMRLQRVRHDWVTERTYTNMYPFSPELLSHPGCHIALSRVPFAEHKIPLGYPL